MEKIFEEKELKAKNGVFMLVLTVFFIFVAIALIAIGAVLIESVGAVFLALGLFYIVVCMPMLFSGLLTIRPNEAAVILLFGKYKGTMKKDGLYWLNPFCRVFNPAGGRKITLKAQTLNNEKQKVNDEEGNPIEIGVVVIWRIVHPVKAVFAVDNYLSYISTQADAAIRQVARLYPYDVSATGDEKSLRGSSQEIAEVLRTELQARVDIAGLEILEARISHLAYAPEIAAVMLQRQQAKAIIEARQMIVDGAVGMVEMALDKLSEHDIVKLDEDKKAAMVCNLLVVLCGNKDAQPIVNSGSL